MEASVSESLLEKLRTTSRAELRYGATYLIATRAGSEVLVGKVKLFDTERAVFKRHQSLPSKPGCLLKDLTHHVSSSSSMTVSC